MENEHGSVRVRNCMEENCNSGSLEEKAIIQRQAHRQQQQVRSSENQDFQLFFFTGHLEFGIKSLVSEQFCYFLLYVGALFDQH